MSGRRDFFSIAAGAVAAGVALPRVAHAADLELAAIGREAGPLAEQFARNVTAFFNLPDGSPDLERVAALNHQPCDRLDELTDRALELNASTMAGFVAKAHLLHHHLKMEFGVCGVFETDRPDALMAMSLARDLIAAAGIAS